jgi:hypothetical protein
VRDLYAGRDLGVFEGGFEAAVPCHDVAVLRVTPVAQPSSAASSSGAGRLPHLWYSVKAAALRVRRALAPHPQPQRQHRERRAGMSAGALSSATRWRPWHDPAAAQLQAHVREAAAARRSEQQQRTQQQRRRRQRRAAHSNAAVAAV